MYLSYRSNKENTCFPSIKTIARECGMAVSTVKRAMGDLDYTGYIKKNPRYRDDNGQTSNLYTLVEKGPVVSESTVEAAPMEETEVHESECPGAIIHEELNTSEKCEEKDAGISEPATKVSHQHHLPISKPSKCDRGGGHLQLKTLKGCYPIIRTSSAIFKLQTPLKRGEPPPSSFP
jgi:DNA-binding transcriptional MocR family regulator